MSEDIILAIFLFGIVGVCGILTSRKKEKPEDHIV
jgi:hypothetical protein